MAGIETLADADAVIGCTARRSYFDPRAASDLTADMARRAPALVVPMSGLALQLFLRASSESMGNHDSDIVDADGVG